MAADIRRMMPESPASIAKTAAEEQLLTRMDEVFGARQRAVAKSLEGKTALAFDLETTHKQIEKARIAEVGAVKRLPTGEIADPLDLVVRPPIKPTPEAYNIWKQGGLTWERVAAQGQSFEEVAEQILRYMNIGAEGRAAEGTVFIGHNIARVTREAPAVRAGVNINLMAAREKAVIQVLSQGYDLPVLAEEMARVGHAFNVEAQAAVMDTQVFLKDALLRHERSKDVYRNTLDELAETFGIAFKHHNARQDAQTSLHAVLKFAGGGYPELRALNLQNLGLQELVDEIGFERAAELISAQGQPTGMESMLAPRDVDAAVGPAPTTTRAETATLRTQKARTASKVEQQALTRAEGAAAGRLGMISKHPLAIGAAAGFGIFLVSQLMDRSQRDQRRMTPEGYAGLLQSMHMRVSGTQSKIPDLRTKLSRLMPVGAWAGPDVHWNQGSRREAMAHIHA
jgi:DNA polymerase III epsilon subunit-like protein